MAQLEPKAPQTPNCLGPNPNLNLDHLEPSPRPTLKLLGLGPSLNPNYYKPGPRSTLKHHGLGLNWTSIDSLTLGQTSVVRSNSQTP
jgi:hypothetical protein